MATQLFLAFKVNLTLKIRNSWEESPDSKTQGTEGNLRRVTAGVPARKAPGTDSELTESESNRDEPFTNVGGKRINIEVYPELREGSETKAIPPAATSE